MEPQVIVTNLVGINRLHEILKRAISKVMALLRTTTLTPLMLLLTQ
jgi:fructose-bisphosphate aldolase class 1